MIRVGAHKMTDTRIEHTIQASQETFWKVFFSDDYNQALFLKELQFDEWKIVSLDDKPDRLERVVDVIPKLPDLPGPLKKLAEDGAGYRERNVFDKKANRMSVSIEPSSLAGKLTIAGTIRTEPLGDNQCKRIVELQVNAKVFGIGGLIEGKVISEVKASYDKAAAFTNRWVKEKGA